MKLYNIIMCSLLYAIMPFFILGEYNRNNSSCEQLFESLHERLTSAQDQKNREVYGILYTLASLRHISHCIAQGQCVQKLSQERRGQAQKLLVLIDRISPILQSQADFESAICYENLDEAEEALLDIKTLLQSKIFVTLSRQAGKHGATLHSIIETIYRHDNDMIIALAKKIQREARGCGCLSTEEAAIIARLLQSM